MITGKRAFLANLIYQSNAYRWLRHFEAKNLVIFNYHRIKPCDPHESPFDDGVYGPTQEVLWDQMRWLRKHTNVISEQDLIDHVRSSKELPRSSVMVTFDDGYRDNADLALPVMRDQNIPAIFFISTRAIQRRELGWWDTIAYLIKHSKKAKIMLRGHSFDLVASRYNAIKQLHEWMRTKRYEQTRYMMHEISEACGVPLPETDVCSRELMSWDQIREVADSGVTIGSHTHTHRVLSTLNLSDQFEELRVSKRILEHELKRPIRSVAYPVGSHGDFHLETAEIAERCGYELGFSFQTGANDLSRLRRFSIGRISAEDNIPLTCAAVTLPSVFARSRCGHEQQNAPQEEMEPIKEESNTGNELPAALQSQNESEIMKTPLVQTIFWSLVLSLSLGPNQMAIASEVSAGATASTVERAPNAERPSEGGDKPTGSEDTTDDDLSPAESQGAVIHPGFLLKLSCKTDAKINGDIRVSYDGKVSLPYDISTHAAGLSVNDFQNRLRKIYQPYFRGTPRINVTVKQKRYWAKVLGLVKNPGSYLLRDKSTLDEALAMASVRTEDLHAGYARIEQGGKTRWIAMEDYLKGGRAHDLPAWQGGEQITFQLERPENELTGKDMGDALGPSSRKIQVFGEVRNPGGVSFQRNADGYYYLLQRGGPTQAADLDKVELLRRDRMSNDHEMVSLGPVRNIKDVQEADVLLVHAMKPTHFEKGLQNTALIATILSSVVLTILVVKDR